MKLLGKEVKIEADIEFGIIEDLENNPENINNVRKFIMATTGLSHKEIRQLKQSDFLKIMAGFSKAQKLMQTDFKKKLSGL